jgi:hypothetical protein
MKTLKLPNAAATQITVTATATSLEDLIRVASGVSDFSLSDSNNAVHMQPEGNIRVMYDGNVPTALIGQRILANTWFPFEEILLKKFKLIREGGTDVKVNIQIGETVK